MTKAWCCWCENGNELSSSGYFWIHEDCFNKICDISSNIEAIKKILEGSHARNRFEKEGKSKMDIVADFIKDMEQWEKQWRGSMDIYEKITGKKSLKSRTQSLRLEKKEEKK